MAISLEESTEMAVLIPQEPKEDCPYSERQVYRRLGRELGDDCIILHSLGLRGHEKKLWGEADIIVLSTDGVFSLEVKGAEEVECRDGNWIFKNRGKPDIVRKESPWTQAEGTLWAIRRELEEKGGSEFRELLYGHGVVMPRVCFEATGSEIEQGVLLDERTWHRESLADYIRRLRAHWSTARHEKGKGQAKLPSPAQIRSARQILRPNLEAAQTMGGRLTAIEKDQIQLTNEQIVAARRMAANPRTIVRGGAGTGKSILAIEKAKHLAGQGKRVLFLCFNRLLASHFRDSLKDSGEDQGIDLIHIHGLYDEIIAKAGLKERLEALREQEDDFFGSVYPTIFFEALCVTELEPWDAVVIDECQDLMTLKHFEVIDLIVDGGLDQGEWHLFLDPKQNIYDISEQEKVQDRLRGGAPAYDDLYQNCRNTAEVATQSSIISGIDVATSGAAKGPACDNVYYSSAADFKKQFEKVIRALLNGGVKEEDIAILSTRKRGNSLIAGIEEVEGRPILDAETIGKGAGQGILFSTMHGFKGLERQVVLAIDMDEIGQGYWQLLHYAGLTRARGLLRTFIPQTRKSAYQAQAKSFAERLTQR